MNPTDRKAFLEIVVGFAELKGKALSAPALELYWNAMQHWSIEDFRAAAARLISTCEWMPTPKHFNDLRRAGELTPGEAWEAVMSGGPMTGRTRRAAHIASSGRDIRRMDLEREVPHVQRRFIEIYRELADVEETRAALPDLTARGGLRIRHEGLRRFELTTSSGDSDAE